jgi:phospholipase C
MTAEQAGSARSMSGSPITLSRRGLMTGIAGAAGAAALSRGAWAGGEVAAADDEPRNEDMAKIEHVVLVMMENRSFDHFLGWLPRADGRQAGLSYVDKAGARHATYPLAPDYQGCGHPDPDHSYEGGRVEYDDGKCDGWLRAGTNDVYSIGYYTERDLAFLGKAAPHWTTCDHYFAAILAETFPNRMYQHAAQTDRIHNTLTLSTLPTIWDRLATAGLTGRYYYSDLPFLGLWGAKYLPISHLFPQFLTDCAAGALPQVSFIDPIFFGEDQGISNDDHPHADIRNGEVFLNKIYQAVKSGPAWDKTLLIINFDEWGGFFEHVRPEVVPIPPITRAAGDNSGLRGFRVPCLLISPWSRRGHVPHRVYDHTSVLKLIERRWRLEPLTVRDREANNLANELDFHDADLSAPDFAVPPGPFGGACAPTVGAAALPAAQSAPASGQEWTGLQAMARQSGWPV